MSHCSAIASSGFPCKTAVLDENATRCRLHTRSVELYGLTKTRQKELNYVHSRKRVEIYATYSVQAGMTDEESEAIRQVRRDLFKQEDARHELAKAHLKVTIRQEIIANNFVDPDQHIIDRNNRIRFERERRMRERFLLMQQEREARIEARNNPLQRRERNLADFANDNQNIHTTEVVQKTKDLVSRILKIQVPPEYATETLKTPGEIILECGLSRNSAWQMMAKYCKDEEIYEMAGIYPLVLNSVWQYIKASDDKEELKKILKSEMEDNIGMCAQGNLSRLCNILSGYLDGLNPVIKSLNEILGDKFAELMSIENDYGRRTAGALILREHNVPEENWAQWIEALG
jgi:hypothetical protein